tara:strand:- start:11 stop:385 length:375 start_codon:yes stop_codon:yes gene_type:complete
MNWKKLWKAHPPTVPNKNLKSYLKWKTPCEAEASSDKLLEMFHNYLDEDDFLRADEIKRHLHLGFVRVEPYGRNVGVRQGDSDVEQDWDALEKARGGRIFYKKWKEATTNPKYIKLRKKSVYKS